MPYSYAIYTGNGSQTQYAVSFPYIRKEHIVAYVNYSLTTAFTWVNDSTIQFVTAPGNGQRVEIRRYSPTNARLVDYTDGSTLVAADLDTDSTQHLYKEQELDDDIKQSVYVDPTTGLPTASNQRITNVLDPVAAQDAATKNYVDTATVASAGDTMTGPLAMSTNKITGVGDPTNAQDASTKNYTDTQDALRLKRDGTQPMTGNLNFNSNKGINLAEPTNPQDAATKNYVDNTFVDNTTDLIDSTETWVSNDTKIATTAAADARHTMVVNPTTPTVPAGGWQIGKQWLQNDANKTLSYWTGSNWSGIASGGTFTLQPTVIYVDSVNGNDINDGHRIINPKKTIKNAVQSAAAGDIIKVAPGVYQEVLPIDITVDNLSIVGDSQRSCFVHPTVATQEQIMFRCNSGTYIDGFTFAGLKASGARGGNVIDSNATYGLPASQGWVAGFYPGCIIKKSPYINNCTNFADANVDNSAFNPNNYAGTGGDLTSAPTGGGIIVDGSLPSVSSPLRSFVVNEFTQVCLDGPGLLVCNNGYAQAVSFFALFCHYHAKALSGGQINMEVGTTDFGRYGLIADGKSSSAIFTATANGNASAGATSFAINAPTAAGTWFGDATRPATNMLVQIGADIYPILSATANGGGWNVVVSRPDPTNRAINLGLINGHSGGATVSFFLRSMISTASHTMEYAGSGTNYNALPENGGVPVEANEVVNLNNGKVWLTSTDQSGKFKVGDTFQVDQQTGFVTIDPSSYSPNIVQDLTPELGGNLDVLTRNIYSSVGNVQINDTLDVTGPILSSTGNVYINDTLEVNSGTAAAPAITFNGDTNTGIYRPGADQLAISTGGSGRLFVDASGNVSINTVSSSGRLTVNATTSSSVYATADAGYAILDAATNASGARFNLSGGDATNGVTLWGYNSARNGYTPLNYGGSQHIFRIGASEVARLDASGRLGVGTSSPSEILDCKGNIILGAQNAAGASLQPTSASGADIAGSALILRSGRPTGSGSSGEIQILPSAGSTVSGTTVRNNSSSGFHMKYSPTYWNDHATLGLLTVALGSSTAQANRSGLTGDATVLTIDGLDTSGQSALEIVGSSNAGDGDQGFIRFYGSGSKNPYATIAAVTPGVNYTSGNLAIRTYNAGVEGTVATFTNTGRLGIGTATPSSALEVNGNIRTYIAAAGDVSITHSGLVSSITAATSISLAFGANNSERARIDTSGRLLVNTSTAPKIDRFSNTALAHFATTSNTQYGIALETGSGITNHLSFKRSGGSIGGNTIVGSSDQLGQIDFKGCDGTDPLPAASIVAEVDGTIASTSITGRLSFRTTSAGAYNTPTERMRIQSDGNINLNSTVYNNTTVNAANMFVNSGPIHQIYRSTSSIRYKTSVETIEDSYSDAILNCRPVWYRSLCSGDNKDYGYWGFIAEEVAAVDPRLVFWTTEKSVVDKDGTESTVKLEEPIADGVQYDRFVPHLLNLIKRQKEQIETMEARLTALEAQ